MKKWKLESSHSPKHIMETSFHLSMVGSGLSFPNPQGLSYAEIVTKSLSPLFL